MAVGQGISRFYFLECSSPDLKFPVILTLNQPIQISPIAVSTSRHSLDLTFLLFLPLLFLPLLFLTLAQNPKPPKTHLTKILPAKSTTILSDSYRSHFDILATELTQPFIRSPILFFPLLTIPMAQFPSLLLLNHPIAIPPRPSVFLVPINLFYQSGVQIFIHILIFKDRMLHFLCDIVDEFCYLLFGYCVWD